MKKIVIVSPTYNEKDNIKPLVSVLCKEFKKLKQYDCHILFVDDSSPDGTSKTISQVMKINRQVHLLSNKNKGGLGHAYKKGMRYAVDKMKADIIFAFDADLSHDPSKIPQFLNKLETGSDIVMGSRYMKGGGIPTDWPPHRKFLSLAGNLFIRIVMANFKIHDWTTGYRAVKKEVVNKIVPLLNHSAFNGYTWQIGFLVKSIQEGYRVGEVPFKFIDRTSGHSKLGPEYIFNTLRYIMKVRIDEILKSRIFKFVMVGGVGALVQFIALSFYRKALPFQLAFFLAIETSILSNFILSNIWTFADRKLKAAEIPGKFVAFNLSSGGSILIQQTIAFLGEKFIGLHSLFTIHYSLFTFTIDTGIMFAVTGILIGMFWNFFAYNKLIWRKK